MTRFSPFADSLWSASAAPAPDLPTLANEIAAEVCVVGGGYSGLTTALSLAKSGIDVVLLEAQEVGFGGSGRNAGHCTPTFHHHSIPAIRTLLGPERGERFIQLQTNAADRVAGLVQDYQIDCEWRQRGYVMAAHTPKALKGLEEKVRSYNAVGQETRLLSQREVAEITGSERQYGGWYHPRGGHVNPLGLSRGLARAAVNAGARIFVQAKVEGATPEGGAWRVKTDEGSVLAQKVIYATGAYTVAGWPGLERTFRILKVFVAASEPLPELRDAILPQDTTLHDGRSDIFVYKRDARDRIVVSMFPRGRRGRDLDYTRRLLTERLRWHHPAVPENLRWDYLWGGELDMQRHTIPRLYQLAPGVVAVTGLSGRGVPTGCILGDILSDWARGVAERDLALPIEPLRPAPGYMGFAPGLALKYYALRSRLSELRAGVPSPPHP
ncbi:MAG: FAD-binding oxidoreductase [Rhodospirillales bacterium]